MLVEYVRIAKQKASNLYKKFIRANLVNLEIITLVDAFVALGGEPDASGFIHKNSIIDILKVEFDL